MSSSFAEWIIEKTSRWLLKEELPQRAFLCDFNHILSEVRPGDILLIDGRSRASKIIKQVTQSPWSHAALYIGQLNDIEDRHLRGLVKKYCKCTPIRQLLIESEIGLGTIVTPITKYKDDHIRILRPRRLTHEDTQKIINFSIGRLGRKYNMRHIFDLARFLFPWGLYPRKWRSILFQHNALPPTEDICSSMIADSFQSINYPILPLVREDQKKQLELVRRNPRLFTPSDFDYSPYFDIIKYPIFPLGAKGDYKNLPWREDIFSNDKDSVVAFTKESLMDNSLKIQMFFTSSAYAVIGASTSRVKFGNKVLRCYIQHNKKVFPVNPNEKIIEGLSCVNHIDDLPNDVKSVSIVTPPEITERIIDQAVKKGIQNIWIQPGAESQIAIEKCNKYQINVIAYGPCILMELGFSES